MFSLDEWTPAPDRAYDDVLLRPPTTRENRKWTARLPAPVLRWRLRRTPEFRRGVAPFLRSAAAALHALGDVRPDAREVRQLHDRWRRVLAGRTAHWHVSSPNGAPDERAHSIDALFADVLLRPADGATRRQFLARWSLGLDDLESLRRELEDSPERARLDHVRVAVEAARVLNCDAAIPEPVASSEVRDLLARWERRNSSERRDVCEREHAPASAGESHTPQRDAFDPDDVRDAARAVNDLFEELLRRPPDDRSRRVFVARLLLGLDDLESLRAEIESSAEYRDVVAPLVALASQVHLRYAHRPASPGEIRDAVDRARTSLKTPEAIIDAIANGTARRKLGIRPLKLEMDVTTQCNLRCTMCYLSDPRYSKRARVDIAVEDFRRIARQVFPHCGLVSLSFGTEPLLHPHLAELLEIAAEEEVPWRYVITNGLLLNERLIEAFVRVPLHGFSVSIDAATKSTYERIRRGGRWERLLASLRALQDAKQRAHSEYPRVTLNFVMMRSNVDELPALVRLADEIGAEGISAMHLTPFDGLALEHELLSAEPERCNAVLAATRAEATRLGMPIALPEPFDVHAEAPRMLKEEPPVGFLFPNAERAASACPFPWQFVGIDPYGRIVPCGWWYTEPPMGDVHARSFDEIWEGDEWRALRREHSSGELRSLCKRCPAAGMGSCNNPRAFDTVQLGS